MMYLGKDAVSLATAVGIQPITGTITPQNENIIQINFGKVIQKFIFLIDMTNTDKEKLVNANLSSNKMYAFLGICGLTGVNSTFSGAGTVYRYNGTSDSFAGTMPFTINTTGFSATPSNITETAANRLFIGYTYNWMVIPLE